MNKRSRGITIFAVLIILNGLLNLTNVVSGPDEAYRLILRPLPEGVIFAHFLIFSAVVLLQILAGVGLLFKPRESFRKALLGVCLFNFYVYFIEFPLITFKNLSEYLSQQALVFSQTSGAPFSQALRIFEGIGFVWMGFEVILFLSLAYFLTRPHVNEQFKEGRYGAGPESQEQNQLKSFEQFGGWLKFFYCYTWLEALFAGILFLFLFFALFSIILVSKVRFGAASQDIDLFFAFICSAMTTQLFSKIITLFRKKEKGTPAKIIYFSAYRVLFSSLSLYFIFKIGALPSFDGGVVIKAFPWLVFFACYLAYSKRVFVYYGSNLTNHVWGKRAFILLSIVSVGLLLWPLPARVPVAYAKMGIKALYQENDFKKSLFYLEKAIATGGVRSEGVFYKAGLLQAIEGNFEAARPHLLKFYEIVKREDPCYYRYKDFVSALDDVQSGLFDQRAAKVFFKGALFLDLNDLKQSVKNYEKSLGFQGSYLLTRCKLGWVYYYSKKYKEAEEQFRFVIQGDPDFFEAYSGLGTVLAILGRHSEALEAFQKYLEFVPENPCVLYDLGNSYQELKMYEEAAQAYHKAIAGDPQYAPAHYNLGNAYTSQGHYELAIFYYQKAVKLDPRKKEAYYNMANAYFSLHNYPAAIKGYRKAVALKPKFANGYYGLALAYSEMGNKKLAVKYCDMALTYGAQIRPEFLQEIERYRQGLQGR